MKNIAFLCCQTTISGSAIRRSDAHEHDHTLAAFRPELRQRDIVITEVCWDDANVDWSAFDAVIIGTTWDYWDRHDLFLETLDSIEKSTKLFNSSAMVRWNSNKQYLKELAESGTNLIPTQWIDEPSASNIEAAFELLDSDDIVVKRQVGAGADGQHRLTRGEAIPELTSPMMVQPFFPSIQTEGELSMIYIDGEYSHALIKRAVNGDYRIQSMYGGTEEATTPNDDDLTQARHVLNSLDEMPLYARVDMLRADSGSLYLMELELIEPYLYPIQGPDLGRLMAEAIERRLS